MSLYKGTQLIAKSGGGGSGSTNYRIGDIITTTNPENPSVTYGGVWQRLENVFLLAASSTYPAGSTGGETSHLLTIPEMPSHLHRTDNNEGIATAQWKWITNGSCFLVGDNQPGYQIRGMGYTGGNQPHNNMPPYKAVYMWEKTAN